MQEFAVMALALQPELTALTQFCAMNFIEILT